MWIPSIFKCSVFTCSFRALKLIMDLWPWSFLRTRNKLKYNPLLGSSTHLDIAPLASNYCISPSIKSCWFLLKCEGVGLVVLNENLFYTLHWLYGVSRDPWLSTSSWICTSGVQPCIPLHLSEWTQHMQVGLQLKHGSQNSFFSKWGWVTCNSLVLSDTSELFLLFPPSFLEYWLYWLNPTLPVLLGDHSKKAVWISQMV